MKTLLLLIPFAVLLTTVQAQQRLHYTLWADGLVNAQLPKSSLYALVGTGLRVEASKPIGTSANRLFAQLGYGHLFQKNPGAFTADIGLLNVGYRYQSRRAFNASVGLGAQYWTERMRVRFADYEITETLRSVLPDATVGIGFGGWSHYRIGLENRVLFRPNNGSFSIVNNLALSVGYTF